MSVVIDSIRNENGYYVLIGRVSNGWKHAFTYWAANPADHHLSFTGSGIPFPNPEVAFENTPNRGVITTETGGFQIQVQYPNAFYMGLGKEYIEPSVFFQVGDNVVVVPLSNGIPFRMVSPSSRPISKRTPIL